MGPISDTGLFCSRLCYSFHWSISWVMEKHLYSVEARTWSSIFHILEPITFQCTSLNSNTNYFFTCCVLFCNNCEVVYFKRQDEVPQNTFTWRILFGKGPGGWYSWDSWDGWDSWDSWDGWDGRDSWDQQINRQLEALSG